MEGIHESLHGNHFAAPVSTRAIPRPAFVAKFRLDSPGLSPVFYLPMPPCFRLVPALALCLAQPCRPQDKPDGPEEKASQARLITREFKLSRNFVRGVGLAMGSVRDDSSVPHASATQQEKLPSGAAPRPLIPTAQSSLEQMGVAFAEGARASLDPFSNTLSVTNTPANLEMVEAVVARGRQEVPYVVAVMLTIIEGRAALVQEMSMAASHHADAAAQLAGLLQQAEDRTSGVRVVGEAFLEMPGGTRANTRSILEHRSPFGFAVDDKGNISAETEIYESGLKLDLEASARRTDDSILDLDVTLEMNPDGPFEERLMTLIPGTGATTVFLTDIPVLRLQSRLAMLNGQTRLLGVSSPQEQHGAGGALWASFLTVHVVPMDNPPVVVPATPRPLKPPQGMQTVAFQVLPGLLENALGPGQTPQQFLDFNGVAPAPGALVELDGDTLTAVNTQENIERSAALVHHLTSSQPKTVALTLHTVKGSGAYLRSLAARAAPLSDHGSLWAELQQTIATGEHGLKIADTLRAETKPGQEAKLATVCEHMFLTSYDKGPAGHAVPGFEIRNVGTTLTFTPTRVYADGLTELQFTLESHPLPPTTTKPEAMPGRQKQNSLPGTRFHLWDTSRPLHLPDGSMRLVSLTRPEKLGGEDVLLATFVQAALIPQVRKHLPPTEPTPPQPPVHTARTESGGDLYTRSFSVAPDFLSFQETEQDKSGTDASTDPFQPLQPRKTAQQWLEEAGVTFPPGSMVSPGGAVSALTVRNTTANLDKVESLIRGLNEKSRPRSLIVTTHIIEAPGPMLRQMLAGLGKRGNHRVELDQLVEAVSAGKARCLNTSRIEATEGTKTEDKQGVEHPILSEITHDEKGGTSILTEPRLVGFRHELESMLHPGFDTADLRQNLAFHTAAPVTRDAQVVDSEGLKLSFPLTDLQVMNLSTSTLIPSGTARLLAVWKPGKVRDQNSGDMLQVIFVTCDLLRPVK